MKRFRFLSVIVAIVLVVVMVSCSAVRYDEGYGSNAYYQPYPYYGTIDPFTGFYYAPSRYYHVYGNRYYSPRGYYRNNMERRQVREYHERRSNNQVNWNNSQRQQQNNQYNNSRQEARTRIFGSRH
ncbi:MAG: hypothetical protein ACJ748_15140 [Flavisolibacter sp.]